MLTIGFRKKLHSMKRSSLLFCNDSDEEKTVL
jgi:hypothetical protein